MKLLLAVLLLAFIGCKTGEKKEDISMPGVYKMLSQQIKNESRDTSFTDDFMMYANVTPPDSISAFGIATYTMSKDTVFENVVYSASDTTNDATLRRYNLMVEKTDKGFNQIIPEIRMQGQNYRLTEKYESIGTNTKSPLDGAWKQIKRFQVSGNDTAMMSGVEYKTYYGGHVIWGQTWSDTANISHTAVGFGKFEMIGNNKLKESMMGSTFSNVRGHDFDIDIEMNGTDEFTQTIKESGTKYVEVYQRLKKL
jgi:hypothetical protein